ncbi:MAG TPA: phosphate/phosphite/phosphonate ABC transporter substrate-binding protein [Candidatus Bipolaricaulota bacterium]
MSLRRGNRFLVFGVVALMLCALVLSSGAERTLAQGGLVPAELVLGMIPSREPAVLLPDLEPFSQLLLQALQARGFAIQSAKAFVPESETATVAALGTGEIHVGFMGPLSAIQAEQESGAKVVTVTVRNGVLLYRGQLMANVNAGYANFEDVIKAVQAGKNVTMSYTSTSSTSGFLFPCAKLASFGILPGNFPNFKTIVAGGHTGSALSTFRGDTQIGWGFDDVRQSLVGREAETGLDATLAPFDIYKQINTLMPIIGYSDWIPNDPQVVAGDLDPALQTAIAEELVNISETEAGKTILDSLLDGTAFEQVESSSLDAVRQVVAEIRPNLALCENQ